MNRQRQILDVFFLIAKLPRKQKFTVYMMLLPTMFSVHRIISTITINLQAGKLKQNFFCRLINDIIDEPLMNLGSFEVTINENLS